MPLSWNEIRSRAIEFSKEWEDESSEDAEAKTFWDSFFNVFGITRRRVASFEVPIQKSDGKGGFVDLLWKGELLVEHKSRGKDLDKAFKQATDYFPGIKEHDLPRYVLVSDFARFRLYDLDENKQFEFTLQEFSKNIRLFGFIAGYQPQTISAQDPVNIEAAERLGKLHDLLKDSGYEGHNLEVLLVRLLFCLFAEDNTIFEKQQFRELLDKRTSEDGADLGMWLSSLFQVLNQPPEDRQKSLDEHLARFPYINGRLFSEQLTMASFNRTMRETLLECTALDWSRVSPAIFGALFQSIKDKVARRNLGEHYTSEGNILKALNPLFLDELRRELERAKHDKARLREFQKKLATLKILDPACGCGNFLVIAYRELRLLELEALHRLNTRIETLPLQVELMSVDVDQMYGIEIEEFPAQIAQVALWMTDHQMNMRASELFGRYLVRLPLKKSPNILHDNALTFDWKKLVAPHELSYIVGNPPFKGKKEQDERQKAEVLQTFADVRGAGVLDYVSCWYRKAVEFLASGNRIAVAFVSTNSIAQGEQVGVLWPDLLNRGLCINFAHRTFQWSNEASGKAAVHCVIIGFGLFEAPIRTLYNYETPKSLPHATAARNINPYLVDAPNVCLQKRTRCLHQEIPEMSYGSMPIDDGWLVLSPSDRKDILRAFPESRRFIRQYWGGDEFLNSIDRYCLWLKDASPNEWRGMKPIKDRVEGCRKYRLSSDRARTIELADTPAVFGEDRQPKHSYLLVPKVSSETREYLPIGFCDAKIIASGSALIIAGAKLYHFGILQSSIHNAWMRSTCGRLESRYQYSARIVYNNFPWPHPTDKQREAIETAAQAVLDARANHPKSTLADLYDPASMPPDLRKAHQKLDKAVAAAYRKAAFATEAEQVAYLFDLHLQATAPLEAAARKAAKRPRITRNK